MDSKIPLNADRTWPTVSSNDFQTGQHVALSHAEVSSGISNLGTSAAVDSYNTDCSLVAVDTAGC